MYKIGLFKIQEFGGVVSVPCHVVISKFKICCATLPHNTLYSTLLSRENVASNVYKVEPKVRSRHLSYSTKAMGTEQIITYNLHRCGN